MATLLMVTLLAWSAGRHHHTKLREDGESLGDWGWRKLSLQTVVCNALWESQLPHTVRQGINQAHARDPKCALCCHTLPISKLAIDCCLLAADLSFFLPKPLVSRRLLLWARNRNHMNQEQQLWLRRGIRVPTVTQKANWSSYYSPKCVRTHLK